MKKYLFYLFITYSVSSFGQIDNPKAKKYFDDGFIQYQSKHYQAADSLFELSISTEPNIDAIFYKSISKIDITKLCKKCNRYKINYLTGEEKYKELYIKNCIIYDSIIYRDISTDDTTYYCHFTIKLCGNKNDISYNFVKMAKNKLYCSFYVMSDTSAKSNPIATFPDVKKLVMGKFYYLFTPDMPEFYGGISALNEFVHSSIRFPDENDEVNDVILGSVIVSFTIDELGNIGNPHIEMGMGKYCNEESIRIINTMPKWNPGYFDGKPVRFKIYYPINFSLRWVPWRTY